jgi:hypothetical protein
MKRIMLHAKAFERSEPGGLAGGTPQGPAAHTSPGALGDRTPQFLNIADHC